MLVRFEWMFSDLVPVTVHFTDLQHVACGACADTNAAPHLCSSHGPCTRLCQPSYTSRTSEFTTVYDRTTTAMSSINTNCPVLGVQVDKHRATVDEHSLLSDRTVKL